MQTIAVFHKDNFEQLCDQLAAKEPVFKNILTQYGYPPLWNRRSSFETLVHIILEQQVSLASAKAALNKLKGKIGAVTPLKLLALTDEELKACYFSRQKIVYTRCLAKAITDKSLSLKKMAGMDNDEIRTTLTRIKGIGNWTVDVFLMMVLNRTDLFPLGDIALVNSLKHCSQLPPHTTREELARIAAAWQPYRTIAAYLLWHAYIKRKNIAY